jgi:hypothetical protein
MSGIRRRPLFCIWWQLAVGTDDREFVSLKITSFIGRKLLPDKDGKRLFVAPDRLLFIQFIRIHELMENSKSDEQALRITCARMLSVYFFPEGETLYNDAQASALEELFVQLDTPFLFKYAEQVSNEFVRICNQFSRIFKGEPGAAKESQATDVASQWMELARNQAGSPLYIEQILQLPAEVVLFDLQGRIDDYHKIKNQIKHDRYRPDC